MVATTAFTPGNFVAVRVGDGSATLTSAAAPVFLAEYTPAGTLVQTIPLPTADASPNFSFTNSGTAHARVTAVEATGATPQSINPGLLGYVLAGSSMRFALASPLPARAGLRAQLNGRAVDLPRAVD